MPRLALSRLAPLMVSAALLAGACADGADVGDARADQVRAAAVEAGLDADVADFLALAARGTAATYQATYPGPEPGTHVVVANRPPDRRVDVLDDDEIVDVRLVLDGEAFECTSDEEPDSALRCTRTDAIVEPLGVFDPNTLEDLSSSLVERVDDFTFAIETTPIVGVEARCLVTTLRPGRERPELGAGGTICVSPEGALLRVSQGDEFLEASDYTTDIPDNTFARPDRSGDG